MMAGGYLFITNPDEPMSWGTPIASRTIAAAVVLCLALGVFATGCPRQSETAQPRTLRVGVLPTDAPEVLREQHGPLLASIQRATDIPTELVIPADDDDLVRMFHERSIEAAYFGGYTYVLARERDGAVPLVIRDVDLRFTSVFLVRPDNPAERLEDLKGARFSFGAPRSTSGHLMPRSFLSDRGIVPEQFFAETRYADGHDATAYWVRDGTVDVGVADAAVIRTMLRDRRLAQRDLKILWETPVYPDSVWAVQRNLAPRLALKIQDALMDLSRDDPEQRRILAAAGARSFLPALDAEFEDLRRVVSTFKTSEHAR